MSDASSLGVVLPTRNSAALLPAHLASMRTWIDLADEVIVVDSNSTDGTESILRQGLPQETARFLSHPPGLYASWNAGIRQVTSRYVYISTVGDTITREGIQQLVDTAECLQADVVLSKPRFKRMDGQSTEIEWPIDDILRELNVSGPRRLHRLEAIVFACTHAQSALTGSCASDLFRTDVLQRFPFPTEFGTSGDGFWGLQNAAQVCWVVVPGKFSTFLLHPTSASQAENPSRPDAPRPDVVLLEAVRRWQSEGVVSEADLDVLDWKNLAGTLTAFLDGKIAFDRYRKARLPWALNAKAWAARGSRRHCSKRLQELKRSALCAISARPSPKHQALSQAG